MGRVRSVAPIVGADHVRLAWVDIGQTSPLSIVFGGEHTVVAGDLVPVAPPGTRVPGPLYNVVRPIKMRRRRYRGQDSFGMLCSLRELGWARTSGDRVAVLKDVLPVGAPLPDRKAWREVVAHPSPNDFEPNTVELSGEDLLAEFRRSSS